MKKMLVVLFALAFVISCNAQGEEEVIAESRETSEEEIVQETTDEEIVHETTDEDGWYHDNFEAASTKAEETGKLLLIDMYADWCGPCRYLSADIFPSPELQPVLSNFVLLKLDVDLPENEIYSQRYNVSSIPCVVIAYADGTEIGRVIGSRPTNAEYAQELETILAEMETD